MTGLIRSEWPIARYGQVVPCNWSVSDVMAWMNQFVPLGYAVAEARNIVCDVAIRQNFEWLFFLDHDVLIPRDCFIKLNQYMLEKQIPVVSGLYSAKCHPAEPLIYRGRGNSYYTKWRLGDKVWVDGIPMGCTLIHVSILKAMAKEAPDGVIESSGPDGTVLHQTIKMLFDTPTGGYLDPESKAPTHYTGTEDLAWCNRVIAGKFLEKAGWGKHAKKYGKFPFLCDTSIFCKHINELGQQFPLSLHERHKPLEKNGKGR